MNAKRAKALRRAARDASVGMPARRLVWHTARLNQTKAKLARSATVSDGYAINDPKTTRGIYRAMKRARAKHQARGRGA